MKRNLVNDLWDFIENVTDDAPNRQDLFFALRERVRGFEAHDCASAAIGKARAALLEAAERLLMNNVAGEENEYIASCRDAAAALDGSAVADTAAPLNMADADRLLGLGDAFMEDWEADGDHDPQARADCIERRAEWDAYRPLFVLAPAMLATLRMTGPLMTQEAENREFGGVTEYSQPFRVAADAVTGILSATSTIEVRSAMTPREAPLYGQLCENLEAWEGEEQSVRDEHADLIEETRAVIDAFDKLTGAEG